MMQRPSSARVVRRCPEWNLYMGVPSHKAPRQLRPITENRIASTIHKFLPTLPESRRSASTGAKTIASDSG